MADATFTLSGLEEAFARLDDLKRACADRFLVKALKKAAAPVTKTAKQLVPVSVPEVAPGLTPGVLRDAITKPRNITRKGRGKVEVAVGVESVSVPTPDGQGTQNPVRYAHLVENGHDGPSPAPPHSFLRAAWDAHVGGMVAVVTADLAASIDRLIRSGKYQKQAK